MKILLLMVAVLVGMSTGVAFADQSKSPFFNVQVVEAVEESDFVFSLLDVAGNIRVQLIYSDVERDYAFYTYYDEAGDEQAQIETGVYMLDEIWSKVKGATSDCPVNITMSSEGYQFVRFQSTCN